VGPGRQPQRAGTTAARAGGGLLGQLGRLGCGVRGLAGWRAGGTELLAGLRGAGPRRERRLLLLGWAARLDRLG
jgi:hypothetical protein